MGIKVNVSEQEDTSGDRGFDPMPIGKYHVSVIAVTLDESQSEAHPGEPMLGFEFVVQDSPGSWQKFANRHDWVNACLWDGALYTIIGILKALPSDSGNKNAYEDHVTRNQKGEVIDLDIPTEPEFYEGREMIIRRGLNKKQKDKFPDMPERWIEVRGFGAYDPETAHKGAPQAEEAPF
jgi:hypothetical protein